MHRAIDSDEEFSVRLPFADLLSNHHPVSVKLLHALPKSVLESCRTTTEYIKLGRLGEGSFGTVYQVEDKRNGKILAMKRILFSDEVEEDTLISSVREITALSRLSHPNVIRMYNLVLSQNSVFVALEECVTDLAKLVDSLGSPLNESQVKCISWQLFSGLDHIHGCGILHRDLKASNILLTQNGEIKIADFGFSKDLALSQCWTPCDVVTLWYRPPEILFQASTHTSAVDMWSAGCIVGELVLNRPLLPGRSEHQQIELISKLIGCPDEKSYPREVAILANNPNFYTRPQKLNNLQRTFPCVSATFKQLLNSLLCYRPDERATALDCLHSAWFREEPSACEPCQLPLRKRSSIKRQIVNNTMSTAALGPKKRKSSI